MFCNNFKITYYPTVYQRVYTELIVDIFKSPTDT